MTNVARRGIALLGLALALFAPAARASDPVDLPLGLAADVSRSVTERKFKLQREGAAAAITHPEVHTAITSGPHPVARAIVTRRTMPHPTKRSPSTS